MELSNQILGKHAVEKIKERIKAPVLTIGSDHFTRAELAKTDCFSFLAASMLSNIITHELKVKNTNDLFFNVAPSALALPGLGVISLATLGAAFESKLGRTLSQYIDHHRPEGQNVVSFGTIKAHQRDTQAEREAKKTERKRKRRRRATAHAHRVERFLKQNNQTTT